MPRKAKLHYFQEPLFEEFKKDICYICHRWIKKNEGQNVGKGVWRHTKCKPVDLQLLKKSPAEQCQRYACDGGREMHSLEARFESGKLART